jgi:hypothetical protein
MLNEIAEGAGMRGVQINTRKGVGVPNPVGTSKVTTPSGLRTALRKQTDFTVIEGDLDGTGTLEQVLRVTAMVQAQPWVHRVRSFSIKPEGKERNRFNLSLGVATLMMPPELAPKESSEPPKIESLNEAARLSWAGIVSKNMFREPAPVQVAAAPPQPANPDPPGPRGTALQRVAADGDCGEPAWPRGDAGECEEPAADDAAHRGDGCRGQVCVGGGGASSL